MSKNAKLSSKSVFINVSSKANVQGDARSKSGFIINELSDNLRSNYKIIAETKLLDERLKKLLKENDN